jgi:hypothetical protein
LRALDIAAFQFKPQAYLHTDMLTGGLHRTMPLCSRRGVRGHLEI